MPRRSGGNLDLVIVCDDATHPGLLAGARDVTAGLGALLVAFTGEPVGEPRLLVARCESGLVGAAPGHVDLKFVSVRDLPERVEDGLVLWQQDGAVDRAYAQCDASWPVPDPQWIEDRFWAWLHGTTVKIARAELFEAVDDLTFMRATALAPLIVAASSAPPRSWCLYLSLRDTTWIEPHTAAERSTPDCLRAVGARTRPRRLSSGPSW